MISSTAIPTGTIKTQIFFDLILLCGSASILIYK